MSNTIFPVLRGESVPVIKKLVHSTNIQTSLGGEETRIANWPQGRYHWTIPFGYLNDDAAWAAADLQILEGLLGVMDGMWDTFLYSDPRDNTVVGSIIGTGDGSTHDFQLARTRGADSHWIYNVNALSAAPVVYLNGVAKTLTTDYTISASGLVHFVTAPGAGVIVTVDFSFYFRVRFDADEFELTNECGGFWSVKEITLFEVMNNR